MIKIIMIFGGIFFAQSQINTYPKEKKFVVEAAFSTENSSTIKKGNISGALGLWYRYPIEEDARLELGGNVKSGSAIYNFDYGKEGNLYKVNSKAVFSNIGGRMIKEFTLKNQKIEWISELTFATLFFDGKDIPDSPPQETEEGNTNHIMVDAESISTFQFVQGFRIWRKNIGFGIKAGFAPYNLLYKKTLPNRFNVFSTEVAISLKL